MAGQLKLMYVEDDPALAKVTSHVLSRHAITVYHCDNIADAKHLIEKVSFDWALLDLKVGQETSLELLACLNEKQPLVKIIVLTGYGSIATAVKAIKSGAHNYLTKPVSVEEILLAFREEAGQGGTNAVEEAGFEGPSLKQVEWETIQKALDENGGNVSATARQLKMHRRTLQRKLQKKPQQLL